MNRIKDYIHDSKIDAAVALCKSTASPSARMIEKGMTRLGRPLQDISTAIENVGKLEISKLEKGFPTLATIVGAEPMLGFLGTVIGMVQSFMLCHRLAIILKYLCFQTEYIRHLSQQLPDS